MINGYQELSSKYKIDFWAGVALFIDDLFISIRSFGAQKC